MKVRYFFASYDFWVGFYWSKKDRTLYICPFPCCVLSLQDEDAYGKQLAHIAETKGIEYKGYRK